MKTKKEKKTIRQRRQQQQRLPLEPSTYERECALAVLGAVISPGTKCKVYGTRTLVTVKGYGWQRVAVEEQSADFLTYDGRTPIRIRPGYVTTDDKGQDIFYPAGELVRIDAPKNYSHLKVIK